MIPKAQKPEQVDSVSMRDSQIFFVNYVYANQLGKVANSHLAKADSFEAGASNTVDFQKWVLPTFLKTTKFSDFMEMPDKLAYESKKFSV